MRPISLKKIKEAGLNDAISLDSKRIQNKPILERVIISHLRIICRGYRGKGLIAEDTILPGEKEQVQVASQINDLPERKRKRVMPSGR